MRRLPILVERAIGSAEASRAKISSEFAMDVAQELGRAPTCMKGCFNCCYFPVIVTVLEALSIYRWLVKTRKWTHGLKVKLQEASKVVWGLAPEVWLMAKVPCAFLEDKECSIYSHRPFTCRVTYSGGDPEMCDPHNVVRSEQISRREPLTKQFGLEEKELRGQRVTTMHFPLASAILFADMIHKGELDILDLGFRALRGGPHEG